MRTFGGYRLLKNQQRAYFTKLLKRDLRFFWEEFRQSKVSKIELLKIYAGKKYNYTPQISRTRNEFNKNSKFKKRKYIKCDVCGDFPTISHHIIQIQNGGLNIKQNIIKICKECHSKIHLWLISPKELEAITKNIELDNEFHKIMSTI